MVYRFSIKTKETVLVILEVKFAFIKQAILLTVNVVACFLSCCSFYSRLTLSRCRHLSSVSESLWRYDIAFRLIR